MFISILYNGINFALSESNGIVAGAAENILPSLQALYDAGQYQVLPDPEPEPSQPNWDGFMTECSDVLAAGMQANYLVFTQIFNMLLALKGKGALDENSPEWRNFAHNYQIGKASLTPEQIVQIESAMANNNIPVLS